MINVNREVFFQLGLDAKETSLYLALLEEGQASVSRVASIANIGRSSAYSILARLVAKGFAGFVVENDVRKYSATDPEKLFDVMEEKKARLAAVMPSLKELKKAKREEVPRVTVYNGVDGFKTVFSDLLRHGKEIVGFNYTAAGPAISKVWYENWQKSRVRKKIKRRYMMSREVARMEATKAPLTEVKIVSEHLANPVSTNIYGDRILISAPGKKTYTGIVIESKAMADSYREFFNALWKKL
ncbi:hypothetical protein HY992_05130 [Candidatus Micrarchaeota archaeon]|nr:hypothetical protein [Candidatus Micrarchaeota archaeon]